jgi:single-stranded-DNA-specific exonuclease
MYSYCDSVLQDGPPDKEAVIDTIVLPHEMTYEMMQSIEKLAPFGMGNPEPLLAWTDVVIISVRKVGKKGN